MDSRSITNRSITIAAAAITTTTSTFYPSTRLLQVFPEQWDALLYYTDCEAAGNCSAYVEQQTTIIDGRRWTARPFRREIYLRARAQGVDTLQYTHRSEGVFRFEIVDLRIPDGEVPAAGKLLTYYSPPLTTAGAADGVW